MITRKREREIKLKILSILFFVHVKDSI